MSDNLSEHLWIARDNLMQAIEVRFRPDLDRTLGLIAKAKKELTLAEENLQAKQKYNG